jgi:hypothetical protein
MVNLYLQSTKVEDIIDNQEAIEYHASQFEKGHRYDLARECFIIMQEQKNENPRL